MSAVFGAAVALRNRLYDAGMVQQRTVKHAVVSVGNLSVGGAGKTPFVMLLGRLLQQHQIAFDILSRGYGRRDTKVQLIDAKGISDLYGDEPLLLARELEVPVIVGGNRVAAAKYAEELFADARPAHGQWLHVLDDGFQHRRLARQFDIVLVSERDLRDRLLPAGRLREPLTALRRADAIVLTDDLDPSALPDFARDKPIWRVRRNVTLAEAPPEKVVAFCGVARPDRFFDDLARGGVSPAGTQTFADHHRYREQDVSRLVELKNETQAEAFVTTAKDLVNLESAGLLARLGTVIELRLRMEWVSPSPADVFAKMMQTIVSRR